MAKPGPKSDKETKSGYKVIRVDPEYHKMAKLLAAHKETSIKEVVEAAIKESLKK